MTDHSERPRRGRRLWARQCRVAKHLSEGDQNHKPARETGTQMGTGADLARGGFGLGQRVPTAKTGTQADQKDEKCRGNIET